MTDSDDRRLAQSRLKKLEAEKVHSRQRYELYRAKSEGSAPTEPGRLEKLERLAEQAESRVAEARAEG